MSRTNKEKLREPGNIGQKWKGTREKEPSLGDPYQHPIQGGVEILLVAPCYRNRDKLRPDGPLGSFLPQQRGMVMKPDKVLCCVFFFALLALTVHKTQYLFSCLLRTEDLSFSLVSVYLFAIKKDMKRSKKKNLTIQTLMAKKPTGFQRMGSLR